MKSLANLFTNYYFVVAVFSLVLDTGSYCVDQTGMELIELDPYVYLCLTSAGIKVMHHPTQPSIYVFNTLKTKIQVKK